MNAPIDTNWLLLHEQYATVGLWVLLAAVVTALVAVAIKRRKRSDSLTRSKE
jgi:hypothetical protein